MSVAINRRLFRDHRVIGQRLGQRMTQPSWIDRRIIGVFSGFGFQLAEIILVLSARALEALLVGRAIACDFFRMLLL